MSLRRISLAESDTIGQVHPLTYDEAQTLSGVGILDVRPDRPGQWRLVPRGLVGAVRFNDVQVEVWPKERVNLNHLLFMLGYAVDPGFRSNDTRAEQFDDLWPALAESLVRHVNRALLQGILQGYRSVEEASTTVRGRIRFSDQFRIRPGQWYPIEVTYDNYLIDIVENRILRTALRRMRAVPRLDESVRATLAHLDNRFDGVEVLRHGASLPAWRPTRLNARYHAALRFSEIVLRASSTRAGPGSVEMAAFVVSMWKVFEDFVTTALREAILSRGGTARAQYAEWLDDRRADQRPRVPMAVDLVQLAGERPVLVFDAKYKAADASGRFPNSDLYQMLAYCTALDVRRAVLVYARGGSPITRRIANTDIDVMEYPLDLSSSPEQMLAAIDALVASSMGVVASR